VSRRTPIVVTVCAAVIAVAAPSAAAPAKPAKAAPLPSVGHRYAVTATGLTAGGSYGSAGAISGDTVITEVPQAVNGGVFYVFVRPKAGWRAGLKPVARLSAPNESTIDPENPATVAISGDTIVISEPGQTVDGDGDQGAVYVYVRPKTGWATTASPAATLTNADGQPGDDFGHASIDGNTIVVGAPGPNGNTTVAGAAFVYVGPPGGWISSGDPTARLSSISSAMGDAFGASTAISGSTIVVASPQAFVFAHQDAGAGFVYVKPTTGWKSATATRQLIVGQGTIDQELTEAGAVAVQGSTVVLGAMDSVVNGVRTGAVYVFARPSNGWASSALVTPAVLTASDGAANDLFGEHVGISGRQIVTGSFNHTVDSVADAGAGYLFAEPTSGWKTSSRATEFGPAKPPVDDHFVAYGIDRATIVAGASGFDTDTGAAYVFAPPPPALSKLAESATSFTIGSAPAEVNPKHHPAGGIVFRFHLNQPSVVTLRFAAGSLTVHGRKGANRIWFDGRLTKHKTVHRGHQKVRFQARDSNGTSTTTTLRLTVH
jgi:hypothetical protein